MPGLLTGRRQWSPGRQGHPARQPAGSHLQHRSVAAVHFEYWSFSPASLTSLIWFIPGINVQKGKGRYRDTHIVTFAPRYLLDNRSSHRLAFAQREFARGKVEKKPSFKSIENLVTHWWVASQLCCTFKFLFLKLATQ